ncbi:MAG: energy-coupling factor transporter ATPase [Clostridiales bacterium]|nr:energy-coupling factor transporter ATPase [Clostridiales bacterium]
MIDIKHVSYRYEDEGLDAVKDVSMHIPAGSFTAILGRNGSGKSTLAKLINGLFLPTEGQILVDGLDTADENNTWEVRKRAGMIFQNPDNQLVATVVRDDVAFGLENLGVPTEEMLPRVEKALESVGMQEHAQRAPHLLSGGQKQRVAIAGVLAMEPKAIICDEATAMLDPKGRREVFDTLRRLNREKGITVLWITHFMEEAAKCDDVYVMHDGAVVMQGKPADIFRDPEKLRPYRLEAPQMASLAAALRAQGIALGEDILTCEDMVREVKKLCS